MSLGATLVLQKLFTYDIIRFMDEDANSCL